MHNEWNYFTPNEKDIYKVYVFDDGNQPYAQYANEWLINGKWKGKISLINVNSSSIKINSISKWKVMKLY
jgi:hypothetical protein